MKLLNKLVKDRCYMMPFILWAIFIKIVSQAVMRLKKIVIIEKDCDNLKKDCDKWKKDVI